MHTDRRPATFTILALVCATTSGAGGQSTLLEGFGARLEAERAALIELRRDLHRHPEVSGREERTAGVVAERLRAAGFEVTTGVGGHGVIGVLRGGLPGPVVAYRADMDAVRSDAPDPVDFRSLTPGVRHICGHDVHTTIGVALAQGLAAVRDRLPGTVMLVFQPAEENVTGAKAMIAAGALDANEPSAIFAVHTAPLDVGQLASAPGGLMAGRDRVRVTVERAADAAATASTVRDRILALGTVTGMGALGPSPPDFVYVEARALPPAADGGRHAVEASITMASAEVRRRTHAAVEAVVAELEGDGADLTLDYEERSVAGVTNDPGLLTRAAAAIDAVLGAGSVTMLDTVIPAFSEDFGSFQALVPGVLFFLGVSNPEKGTVGMPHSPGYVADEEAIFVGARAMAAVLLDFLASQRP
jgi:metal-dependent amidase/aminoacylase/carboxypeptidase family protein